MREQIRSKLSALLGDKTPLHGYQGKAVPAPHLDSLSDEQLEELNAILRWNCFTVDTKGRRFGRRASQNKRATPQVIPDERIIKLNQLLDLTDKTFLEIGCFEGVHTIGLGLFSPDVTAVDGRIENVVKTLVRSGFYGIRPRVFACDVDNLPLDPMLPVVDVIFHCGVLYHLKDPVRHLKELLSRARCGILLDTHYAMPEELTQSYEVDGKKYGYKTFEENDRKNVFAGLYDHAKWLSLDALLNLLRQEGLTQIHETQTRNERNGARVMIIASRGSTNTH